LVVQFQDASAGTPSQWSWDLGNGNTSAQQNPGALYTAPGSYTIKLTVKNAGGADSVTKVNYITVYAQPVVDFSIAPTSGCAPVSVQFTDKSNPGSGTSSQWTWDFGDGQLSSDQNPLHIYTTIDTFSVSLNVTNSFGCSNFLQKSAAVVVNGITNPGFDYTYTNACSPPTKVTFSNSTASNANISYQWFFGDGNASSQQSPVYTYTANGKYTVQLIASTDNGCSDTVSKVISIGTVSPDFTIPQGACVGKRIFLADSSSPTPVNVNWDFGDGKTGVGLNTNHIYTAAGNYNIKYVANFGSCSDSITKAIAVTDKPSASFTSTGNKSTCSIPQLIQFQNTSANGVNYMWNFGDGIKSTTANPSHNYTKAGFYDVTLVAFNSNGCSDTIVMPRYIELGPPVIDSILNAPFPGCVPQTVNFQAAISSGDPIATYSWTFGDGGTSISGSPSYTYAKPGTYNVNLKVVTTSGCSSKATFNRVVMVGNKPIANFITSSTNSCASSLIQFTDKSTGNVTNWHWDFGDNTISSSKNPSHLYADTGYFTIMLTVESNGCASTKQLINYVYINPPVAKFSYTYKCSSQLSRTFISNSTGAKTWAWDFGDGQTSNSNNPTHTYSSGGTYIIKLKVTNNTCADSTSDTLNVLNQTISVTVTPQVTCKFDSVVLKAVNYNTASISSFYWNYGDGYNSGFPGMPTEVHKYKTAGTYSPQLIIKDVVGCRDTVTKPGFQIKIFGPTAAFSNQTGTCINKPLKFNDSSYSDGSHPIQKWIWDYGDKNIDSTDTPPFQHTYSFPNIYSVKLKVLDSYGCVDSIFKSAIDTITYPIALFSALDSVRCTNSTTTFIDSSQGLALQCAWDFGDGNTSSQFAPQHLYANAGSYTVSLKITDEFGCTDSISKNKYISIANPKASFTLDKNSATCPPLIIHPVSTSSNYSFITWEFGDGNSSNQQTPVHYYTIPGNYTLQLIAQGHGNCFDTTKAVTVTLTGPTGNFNYTPDKICTPDSVAFTAQGTNVTGYNWAFGDGTIETTTKPAIKYAYQTAGVYLPKLILVDASGCQVPITGADSIKVFSIVPKFGALTAPGCDSALVNFTDSSQILVDTLQSYLWTFGDGTTSSLTNPSHYYFNTATENVSLKITGNNCTDVYTLPVNVIVHQSPVVSGTIPASVCVNSGANFSATNSSVPPGTISWLWQFGNGASSSAQDTSYTYTVSNTYTVSVTATNEFGCTDSAQGNITVQPFPGVDAGADSTICLGQTVTLQPTGAITYSWTSDPSLSCSNCTNPVASPDSTTRYYVSGTGPGGCASTDSVLISVNRPITISLTPVDSLCLGGSIQLNASGAEVYNWQPSTGLSSTTIPNPVASPGTTTAYTVTGSDTKNCFSAMATAQVNVYPNPTVNLIDSVVTITVGSTYVPASTVSADVTQWLWTPFAGLSCNTCAQPTASPVQTTTYQEKVTNQFGCSAADNVTVRVVCNQKSLYIPNTFSPNGDGMNDYFYPRGVGLYSIRSMRIFNRWGQVVFERVNFAANDVSNAWDGKFNGKPQPADVYVYAIEIICDNGTVLTTKGDITLLR